MTIFVGEVKGVFSDAERHDQMLQAVKRGFPFLKKAPFFNDRKVSIVGYGPSLRATWNTIPKDQPIITVSGAHDYLVERGVIPTWHVDIDPRPNKAAMLKPHKDVMYLMASVCHPDVWDVLWGFDVRLWHLINDDATVRWVRGHHPAGLNSMLGGGPTAGQRAMNVAAALGFRRFDMFGVDFSFEGERHAGPHTETPDDEMTVRLSNGEAFRTTPQMLYAAREMQEFLNTADAEVTFHGEGLMQTLARPN